MKSEGELNDNKQQQHMHTYLRVHLLPSSKKLEVPPMFGLTNADANRGRRQRRRMKRRQHCNMM